MAACWTPLGHWVLGWGPPQPWLLQMCRKWQLTRRQKRRLKSRQVKFGEGTERLTCWVLMGGLEVLVVEEVGPEVSCWAWAEGRRKDWLARERVGQLMVRWP